MIEFCFFRDILTTILFHRFGRVHDFELHATIPKQSMQHLANRERLLLVTTHVIGRRKFPVEINRRDRRLL